MRLFKQIFLGVWILSFMLCLCACSEAPAPQTTAPSQTVTTPPTLPNSDAVARYDAAVAAVSGKTEYTLDFGVTQTRTVGGEAYTQSRSGTAYYAGLGSDDMSALVSESFLFGDFQTQFIQSYRNGSGWCRVSNCNFRCDMTQEMFLSQQLPAVLLDRELYTEMVAEQASDGTVLYFSGATGLEPWITEGENAQLTEAHGKLALDGNGNILSGSYHAEFTRLTTLYTMDVTVEITYTEALDFESLQPVYPEDCPQVDDLQVLRYLLQTVGGVYTSENMSVSYQDTLYSQAFGQIRTQTSTYDTYGSGDSFLAGLTNEVSITDYSGAVTTNSQTVSYRDGQYQYSYNGGEPTLDPNVTAEQIRTSWEDSILSALMMPDFIAGAELTDTGDLIYIQFTGNEALAKSLCSGIYSLFQVDLDTFAESYSTEYIRGYLSVNKHTGLPVAMGLSLSRSHVINGVSYLLTYQLDQALTLSSAGAYQNITGEAPPQSAAEAAAPLLYKVTGADGQTLYLLGTIHVGDHRTANLPQALMDAFAACDAVALECDNAAFQEQLTSDAALQQWATEAYYYRDGTSVRDHIGENSWAQLEILIPATGANHINAPYLKTIFRQNQLEALFLEQSYSLTPECSMEARLQQWAAQQEKPVYEIESAAAQIAILSGLSPALQELLLMQTMELGISGVYAEITELYALWCQGDEAALQQALAISTEGMDETEASLMAEYQKAVITDRNAGMLTAATGYLESGETVFFAVGLSHLLGDDGLAAGLRNAGYTVETVVYE